jgi:hypothetical protein
METVMLVLHRDGYRCVRCSAPIEGPRGEDWSAHHRKPRGRGGDNSPSNIVALCGSGTTGCHGFVESYRAEAYVKGWLVHTHHDPVRVPVLVDRESRWVHLTVDGQYCDNPPETP